MAKRMGNSMGFEFVGEGFYVSEDFEMTAELSSRARRGRTGTRYMASMLDSALVSCRVIKRFW